MKKISVVTVCLNNLAELKRTVDSVVAQTYADFEFVVVDGGSTDGCKEYIESVGRVDRRISERDSGVYNAMNKGARLATGKYILYLNSGDIFYSNDALAKAAALIDDADYYMGIVRRVPDTDAMPPFLHIPPAVMTIEYCLNNSIPHQATYIKRELLEKRPYNEKHKIVSDWEHFFESWALDGCSYSMLDVVVAEFYCGGISSNEEKCAMERNEILDACLPVGIKTKLLDANKSKFERRVGEAMTKAPVKRELMLLRYAFKSLLKSIFGK
ncbi:MAG: glycosyltransferase [Bacteroidaceae bacterium]|nr:glycosyltransferase [Bacteroidaceae bacterium]